MSDKQATAYVTVYHTVNINIGLAWLAIPAVAIVAILAVWKAAAS